MEFPETHPDLEKILKDQGLDEDLRGVVMMTVVAVSIKNGFDVKKSMEIIANGLLSYVHKMAEWKLTPDGMAFSSWCAENPKEAYEVITKHVKLEQIMKNRMN